MLEALGCALEVSCLGLGELWGCAGALSQPVLWTMPSRRSTSPRQMYQRDTSHLPHCQGGHVTRSCHRPLLLWQWLLCSGKSFAQPVPGACTLNLLKGWCSAGQRGGWVGGKAERPTLSFLPFPSGTFLPWSGASAGLGRARLVKVSPVLLAARGR